MNIHFIAIGGSAMHNLAIALHKKGYKVSGSDDEIFDPSRRRLLQYGLLPKAYGWFPEKIHKGLDAVILGMHARADNPELLKAKEMDLKVYSYPEFLYEQSKDKTRVVIGGSHGKTTITSMILHVLQYHKVYTDYMVGAQLEGFEVMVRLSEAAPFMIMEGDEYLSSPIDRRPKFHLYRPHIALLSGIAWDHINVFPTFEDYLDQFRQFIQVIEENGKLIYCTEDPELNKLSEEDLSPSLNLYPYGLPDFEIRDGKTYILHQDKKYSLRIFGRHNLLNLNGARLVCQQLGVSNALFFEAMESFKGASNRLEKIFEQFGTVIFRDFAHAPSKLKATTAAVKEQYPEKTVVACMELHTFSSLNQAFLDQYAGAMNAADVALVFFSPHALQMKKLPDLDPETVRKAFGKPGLEVFTDTALLSARLEKLGQRDACFLFMSSGNFGGLNLNEFAQNLRSRQNETEA
ncbi:MAG: Mur ligase family protein [Bacteroides sp.]|jgi:UDP-N-acetylmuramate: L-alanyl-gamma-D-glutamyl-meso-diaminopimelate ligase|nr:Mur ligase family protein [Bacteroides sp.]